MCELKMKEAVRERDGLREEVTLLREVKVKGDEEVLRLRKTIGARDLTIATLEGQLGSKETENLQNLVEDKQALIEEQ